MANSDTQPVERSASKQARFIKHFDTVMAGLRAGRVGVWRWRVSSEELLWSDNLEEIHALPPGTYDGTLPSFTNDVHADDAEAVWQAINNAVESGQPYSVLYRTSPVHSGSKPLWIRATGELVSEKDGTQYLTGVCQDVSDTIRTQTELQRRLAQQQAASRLGSFALAGASLDDVMREAVSVAAETLNVPLAKILEITEAGDKLALRAGRGWKDGLVGKATVGADLDSQAGYTLSISEPVIVTDLQTEQRFTGPALLHDHGVRSGLSVVIAGSDARPFGVFGVHTTEPREFDLADADFLRSLANIVAGAVRHDADAVRRQLLVKEMAHRAGNMLQMVGSIFNQTFSTGADVETARRGFQERLSSLSRANLLISSSGWTNTRFRVVLDEILEPFSGRYVANGRDLLLPAGLSFDLSLVLHELATNSAKYGALSGGQGQSEISWRLEKEGKERTFHLTWKDVAPGSSKRGGGFGSKLLHLIIERKWNGAIEIEMTPAYIFTCRLPLSEIADEPPVSAGI